MGQQHEVVAGAAGEAGRGRAPGRRWSSRGFWHPRCPGATAGPCHVSRPGNCYVSVMVSPLHRLPTPGWRRSEPGLGDGIEVAATVRTETRPTAQESPRAADEPAPTRSPHRPLGGGQHRPGHPAPGLRPPGGLHPGRHLPTLPVLPGQRGERHPGTRDHGPDGKWLVRVVPNLYPAFEGNAPFVVTNRGPVFTQATAGGIHEVIVLSPEPPELVVDAERRADHGGDDRHPRPDRGALVDPRAPLQPGHRQRRARGGRLHRAPPRPAARDVLRPP